MSKDQGNSFPPGVHSNANFTDVPKNRVLRAETARFKSTFYPAVLRVTTKEQLVEALGKGMTQVVIADKKLARPFEWLLWAQELRWWYFGTLIAATIAYAISQSYGVNLKSVRAGRNDSWELTLTPTKPISRPSQQEVSSQQEE